MMMKKLLGIVAVVIFLSSCKGTKDIPQGNANSNLALTQVLQYHDQATPKFNTLGSRVQVVYEDASKTQSITVSLRMEKDQTIWIKASILGITLAKALITPDRVSYYETINNTYFDGDFSIISDWLGTSLNFQQVQAILLGQSIFTIPPKKYEVSVTENKYKIQPRKQPQDFIHSLFLDPANFKVVSGSLSQPNEGRLLSILYDDYQKVEESYYPSSLFIHASEGDENTKISVSYKKIDVNASVSFPFSIPSGYEEIRMSK